jgi:hypothetical protein
MIDPSQKLTNAARRWLMQQYPELAIPPVRLLPRVGQRPGAIASSSHDNREIYWNDPSTRIGLQRMGATGRYGGLRDQKAIATLIHELTHQSGPRYGDSPRSRFWEEGLAERVSTDLAPEVARRLKYSPEVHRFEDGSVSNPNVDFNFRANTYGPNVRAVDDLSFGAGARANPNWAGMEDPTFSPEAIDFRRLLLALGEGGRQKQITRERKRKAVERKKPDYLPKTVRNVGRVASSAGKLPTDSSSAAARQVGRSARAAGRRAAVPTPKIKKALPKPKKTSLKDKLGW